MTICYREGANVNNFTSETKRLTCQASRPIAIELSARVVCAAQGLQHLEPGCCSSQAGALFRASISISSGIMAMFSAEKSGSTPTASARPAPTTPITAGRRHASPRHKRNLARNCWSRFCSAASRGSSQGLSEGGCIGEAAHAPQCRANTAGS